MQLELIEINLYLRMGDKKEDRRKREDKSTVVKGTETAIMDDSEGDDNDTIEPPTLKPPLPPRKRKSLAEYFRPGAFSKRY